MSRSFDHYWNSAWAIPIAAVGSPVPSASELEQTRVDVAAQATDFRAGEYVRDLRKAAFGAAVRSGEVALVMAPAQVFYNVPPDPSAPVLTNSEVFTALRGGIENAKQEVVMVSPYLVPGDKGRELLCALAARRVRVRVLTNSLASTDVAVVHAGYARYRPQLAACGVHLYELRPQGAATSATRIGLSSGARLHSKAIVVDGQTVFIGSMNLDPRSRQLNTELALRIDSDELGRQITALFDEATTPDQAFHVRLDPPGSAQARVHWDAVEAGQPVRYTREPMASAWRRWVMRLLGALAPEELL
ncbi:MAG TPA: phospholipase D-like domain-containing protein [Ramlibacter sp.]|nr:phospholipase D-like domain-containing protein [Ramlibacter sp.]